MADRHGRWQITLALSLTAVSACLYYILWAVFHLTDELTHREDVSALAAADLAHLSGDARRVYSLLLAEWITYLGHLREDYPYLYSLALRTNPFDPSAFVEVR